MLRFALTIVLAYAVRRVPTYVAKLRLILLLHVRALLLLLIFCT